MMMVGGWEAWLAQRGAPVLNDESHHACKHKEGGACVRVQVVYLVAL
jgi:hypothetical protein